MQAERTARRRFGAHLAANAIGPARRRRGCSAAGCRAWHEVAIPDEDLISDAYPAGRDEADLQRIYRASRNCDWRPDPNPATRTEPPPAVMEAITDKEYQRAMSARSMIACRRVVPDVFEAVLPLITDSDSAVRTPAMTTAAYCLDHPALGDRKGALAELLADTAAVSPDPRERAAVARLLGVLGGRPEALLRDEHPGVRAEGWLAPAGPHHGQAGAKAGYFPFSKLRTGLPNGNGLPPTDTMAVPR